MELINPADPNTPQSWREGQELRRINMREAYAQWSAIAQSRGVALPPNPLDQPVPAEGGVVVRLTQHQPSPEPPTSRYPAPSGVWLREGDMLEPGDAWVPTVGGDPTDSTTWDILTPDDRDVGRILTNRDYAFGRVIRLARPSQ